MNPMSINATIARALPLCEPSSKERRRITAVAEEAKALVDRYVANIDDIVAVEFGGSFAKDTWLQGDADIDIFFKVKPSVALEEFEELGRTIGLNALKGHQPRLRYSDHPYVEAIVRNVRINIVPCYDVEKSKWQSAADRSPFHTEFININFDDNKRKQTRLLKKFLKAAGIYGAEIATGGFSGYLSEVLVMLYSSFEGILRAAANWHAREVMAAGEYDLDAVKGFSSPVIIIDPVDSRRNLGTAISSESIAKFMLAARAFLDRPTLQFFEENQRGRAATNLHPNVLVVEFLHRERSPDVIWGQLKRSMNAMAKQLELAEFAVLRSSCVTDEKKSAALAFLLESITLAPYTKKKGPEVFRRNEAASFLSNKKKSLLTWVDKEMRIAILVDRQTTDARKFAKSLLQNTANSGLAKDLIVDKLRIYSGKDVKIKGVAKKAVEEVVSTERLIF